MKRMPLPIALAGLLALAVAAPAGAATPTDLELLSDSPSLSADPATPTTPRAASLDGRRVIFTTAEALLGSDTDGAFTDLYARNPGGSLAHLSDGADGAFNVNVGTSPASADGSAVAFVTGEPLLPAEDTDTAADVYLAGPGGLALVSDPPSGPGANLAASFDAISADGSKVAIETREPLLPAVDTDTDADVYLWTAPGTLTLMSDGINAEPDPAGVDVYFSGASPDLGTIVMETAGQLTAIPDADGRSDLYSKTGASPTIKVTPGDGAFDAGLEDVSDDGTSVLFNTNEPLTASDTDTAGDIYQFHSGALSLRSDKPGLAADANAVALFRDATPDHGRVAFNTAEALLPGDVDAQPDGYVSGPGTALAAATDAQGADVDQPAGATAFAGSTLFVSASDRLDPADTDDRVDVYAVAPDGTRTLVSDGEGPDGSVDASFAGASADGQRVAFSTTEALLPSDGDASSDIYVHTPRQLVHATDGPGPDVNTGVAGFRLSADGQRLVFSTAEALLGADSDGVSDIYRSTLPEDPPAPPPPPPPPPGGGSGPPADRTAPRITVARLARTAVTAGTRPALQLTLSEPAAVTATVTQRVPGRRAGGTCRPGGRRGTRCTATVTRATLRLKGTAGTSTLRLALQRLKPGTYRIAIVARDAAGNRSAARSLTLTVRAARR